MKTYLFSYNYRGGRYVFEVPAADSAEAIERVRSMAMSTYDGELKTKIPIAPTWLARLFGMIK